MYIRIIILKTNEQGGSSERRRNLRSARLARRTWKTLLCDGPKNVWNSMILISNISLSLD